MRKIFPADMLARDDRFVRLTTEQRLMDPRSPGSRPNPRGAMQLTPDPADAPDAARALMHGLFAGAGPAPRRASPPATGRRPSAGPEESGLRALR